MHDIILKHDVMYDIDLLTMISYIISDIKICIISYMITRCDIINVHYKTYDIIEL